MERASVGPRERTAWSAALVVSLLLYLGFAFVAVPGTFGVGQLRHLWPPSSVTAAALLLTVGALGLGLVAARPLANRTLDELMLAGLAVGSYAVFLSLQTHFLNYDG